MSKNEMKDAPNTDKNTQPKMRQIILETDGTDIKIVKAEVAGKLELTAILQAVIGHINQPMQK